MSFSIDYNILLSSDHPAIPYDVTFLISDQEKKKQGEIQAHKFIFALNSLFFKSRFCGAGNFAGQNDKEVEITGTLEAIQFVTNFLYNKPTTIEDLSVDNIFNVVDLAHCYDLTKLEEALEKRLLKMVIAKDDVIEAAKKAEEFARFETASQALLKNCAKTLQESLIDAEAVFDFGSKVADTGDEAVCLRLFAKIKDLPPMLCSNCRKSPCVSGTEITSITQVRVGTRLTANPRIFGMNRGYGRSEVVAVDTSDDTMTVKVKAGEGSVKFATVAYRVKTTEGNWFCFAC